MNNKNLFLVLAFCIQFAYGRLPDGFFPICSRIDPDLKGCLIHGIEAIRPMLAKGIPDVELPPLDPLTFQKVVIDSPTWVPGFVLKGVLRNVVVNGIGNLTVKNLTLDRYKDEITAKIVIPQVKASARYNSKGARAFFMALESTGKLMATFNDVTALIQLRGITSETKNDLDYIKIALVKAKINVGPKFDINIKPDNSGQPSKILADLLKKVSKRMMVQLANNVINNELAGTIRDYVNKLASEIPIQDLLID